MQNMLDSQIGIVFVLSMGFFGSVATSATMEVSAPWVRQPHGHVKVTGAFFTVKNLSSKDDRLMRVSCDLAENVEIHRSSYKDGMMSMEEVSSVPVAAGKSVALKPGSLHIMLMGLKEKLKAGQLVPLTLHFKKAGGVEVKARVKSE